MFVEGLFIWGSNLRVSEVACKEAAKTNKNTTHAKTKTRTVPRELRLGHRNADRGTVSTPEQARKENDVDSVQALPHALRRKRARNGPNMLLHECPQRTLPGSRPRAPPLRRRAPLQGSRNSRLACQLSADPGELRETRIFTHAAPMAHTHKYSTTSPRDHRGQRPPSLIRW